MKLEIDEGERQMLLLALAHLSIERPGWDHALNRIALKCDNDIEGRAQMYTQFRGLHKLGKAAEDRDAQGAGEALLKLGNLEEAILKAGAGEGS